jgi:transcriptional regulator, arsR family|nr:metalloregulator ArsR/SmtB family transcription factor [uncultured Lachnoanaerobaculum sp.]
MYSTKGRCVEVESLSREEAIDRAKINMLEAETIDSLSKLFKVLGDPTRIKILWALNVHDLCVLDICEVLGMTKSAVSHQLGTLKEAKLVKARREGKEVYYSLDDEHVKEIFETGIVHVSHRCKTDF